MVEEGPTKEEEAAKEEEGSVEEKEVPTPKKKSRAGTSCSSTRPLVGSMFEVATVTKDDIVGIRKIYHISEDFHLYA